jgi:hypothetical protein
MYKEILVIRKINEDTAVANPLIRERYEKKSYSEKNFQQDFIELSKEDPQKFAKKVDSIRAIVSSTNVIQNNENINEKNTKAEKIQSKIVK